MKEPTMGSEQRGAESLESLLSQKQELQTQLEELDRKIETAKGKEDVERVDKEFEEVRENYEQRIVKIVEAVHKHYENEIRHAKNKAELMGYIEPMVEKELKAMLGKDYKIEKVFVLEFTTDTPDVELEIEVKSLEGDWTMTLGLEFGFDYDVDWASRAEEYEICATKFSPKKCAEELKELFEQIDKPRTLIRRRITEDDLTR